MVIDSGESVIAEVGHQTQWPARRLRSLGPARPAHSRGSERSREPVFDKPDKSIYWLSESIKDRSEYLIYINVDPLFDSIRQHQGYPEILRQIGLTP
ncbi:MAG: hypothetical protein DMG13_11220 [Acidobacteria bacterium]|nr:MAG: hypothetical protein DMG13_11220 [Acidobacteriota bacterium]